MKTESMLLPCPFCGRVDDLITRAYTAVNTVECLACKAFVLDKHSLGKAIAAWNRRTQPAAEPDMDKYCLREHAVGAIADTQRELSNAMAERDAAREQVAALTLRNDKQAELLVRLEQKLAQAKLNMERLASNGEYWCLQWKRAVANDVEIAQERVDQISANLARLPPEISRNGRP